MRSRLKPCLLYVLPAALCVVCLHSLSVPSRMAAAPPGKAPAEDNKELAQLYREDQDDRKPADIDWSAVQPRDRKREARVKELYTEDRLRTGADYYHAAMILQHAPTPEDYLLAHELCIVAIGKGEERAKWLAAASEDRFLMMIGRPQRFGTQYRADGPDGPMQLYKVGPGVTDELRRAFAVPSLKEAKARAVKMNEERNKSKKP
jgi:hypothetical protein